jgi:hypothetical protein
MNEPTEHAQQTTGKVTARALLSVLKGCASASLHGYAAPNRASYSDSFVFDVVAKHEKAGIETRKTLAVPGWVSNGLTDEGNAHRPIKGFWWLYAVTDRVLDVLDLLPSDAEVSFHVYQDAGTSPVLTDAKLHADHLYLCANYTSRGKRVTRTFMIDAHTGKHNSARFGYFYPDA